MDEENMYIAFRNLEINEKRNLYNEEVVKLYELLKNINGNSTEQSSVLRNYNINADSELTEEEYLSYEFENIYLGSELEKGVYITHYTNLNNNDNNTGFKSY